MSNKDEAYKPFVSIRKHLEATAETLGLDIERLYFTIDPDNEHTIHVVWTVKAEAILSEKEKDKLKFDRDFDDIIGAFEDDFEQTAEDIKNDLNRMFGGDE